ncbi:sugar ABC transporter permease [Alicyclobacillus curvatus]|nr:sugar ABC transporter permease [Alicyclobacillus curvatus]
MRNRVLWFATPAIGLYLLVFVIPILASICISLFRWSGYSGALHFVGLTNYAHLISDPQIGASLKNNFALMIVGGAVIFFFSLFFTFTIWRLRHQSFIRALLFFPSVVPPIALAILWAFLYNFQYGLINGILSVFHIHAIDWTSPNLIFVAAVVALIWINVGFYTVILLAGVSKVPQHIIDAAHVDGASNLNVFMRIVIPMIGDVLSVAVALWVVTSVKTFDFLFAFAGAGQVPTQLWTLGIYQYVLSFGTRDLPISNLGYAEAVAVLMVAVVGVGFGLVNLVFRRKQRMEY